MAPQSIGTNGPAARRLRRWIARATSSFPVPVSPSTSTSTFEPATLLDGLEHAPHRGTCADDLLERIGAFDLTAEKLILGTEPPFGQHAHDAIPQLIDGQRLCQKIGGPQSQAGRYIFHRRALREQDHRQARIDLVSRFQHGQAVDLRGRHRSEQEVE